MKNWVTLFLMLVLPLFAAASERPVPPTTHRAVIQHVEPDACLKLLFTGIIDLMPSADVVHDAETGTHWIVSPITLSWGELEAVVNASGHQKISLDLE
jgi:hypothetical protein